MNTPKKLGIFPCKYVVALHNPKVPFGMTSGETSYVAGKTLMVSGYCYCVTCNPNGQWLLLLCNLQLYWSMDMAIK